MSANNVDGMLGFEDAVFKTFEMATVDVLRNSPKFLSYVTDLCDHSEKPFRVFVRNCSDELLAPLVEVSHDGDAAAIKMAASKCVYTLTEDRGIEKTRALECVDGLAGALARTRGVAYEPLASVVVLEPARSVPASNVAERRQQDSVARGTTRTQVRANVQGQAYGNNSHTTQAQPSPVVQQAQYAQQSQATYVPPIKPQKSKGGPIIGIVALFLIVAIAIAVLLVGYDAKLPFGTSSSAGASSLGTQTATQGESDGALADGSPSVKTGLSDYTWGELSQIGMSIGECSSRDDALAIAEEYNLVGPGGEFGLDTKVLELTDGSTIDVGLVDVWHDEADTLSGKAGLTFLATTSARRHSMSDGKYSNGGWEMSSMRSWLSTTFVNDLPDDLRDAIVPAYKWSNNVGKASSIDCVTSTYDKVWIPSIVEVAGEVNWEYHTDPSGAPLYNSVFNAEGYEYAAFEQAGIVDDDANALLSIPGGNWWLRSTAASTGRGRYVKDDGDPSGFGDSNNAWQVVIGFCL